jgi:hypothetical protein
MSHKGTIGVLNVGAGDTKLTFDKNNPIERIRSARIVTDMIKRGYVLLVEVERDGVKSFQRVLEFDPDTCEYIIADFDPIIAARHDEQKEEGHEPSPEAPRGEGATETIAIAGGAKPGQKKKRVDAGETRSVAVARSAGG